MSEPDITLELQWKNIVFRIRTNQDMKSLENRLDDVISFVNRHSEKLLGFGNTEIDTKIPSKRKGRIKENEALVKFRFPAWFYNKNTTLPIAIGLILYDMSEPISSRAITEIITKEWKKVELRNISKQLTTKGGTLYSYIRKDIQTKGYYFTTEGKKWFETKIIPKIKAE